MDIGIRFHGELLRRIGLDPVTLHPVVQPRPPALRPEPVHRGSVARPVAMSTEEEHEVRDALSPVYDQLSLAPYWWVFEMLPGMQKRKWAMYVCFFFTLQAILTLLCGTFRPQPEHGARKKGSKDAVLRSPKCEDSDGGQGGSRGWSVHSQGELQAPYLG